MFPDDDVKLRGPGRATTAKSSGGGHGGVLPLRSPERGGGLAVVATGGQRGTLYDSFELNAMVVRLNRLLNGDGAGGSGGAGGVARRPRAGRTAAAGWLAAPKALLRKIKGSFLGARRGDG